GLVVARVDDDRGCNAGGGAGGVGAGAAGEAGAGGGEGVVVGAGGGAELPGADGGDAGGVGGLAAAGDGAAAGGSGEVDGDAGDGVAELVAGEDRRRDRDVGVDCCRLTATRVDRDRVGAVCDHADCNGGGADAVRGIADADVRGLGAVELHDAVG